MNLARIRKQRITYIIQQQNIAMLNITPIKLFQNLKRKIKNKIKW